VEYRKKSEELLAFRSPNESEPDAYAGDDRKLGTVGTFPQRKGVCLAEPLQPRDADVRFRTDLLAQPEREIDVVEPAANADGNEDGETAYDIVLARLVRDLGKSRSIGASRR
jgi:hypothetical protein